MTRVLLLTFGLFALTSFVGREILIDETGFKDIRIGETTMAKIKRRHIFAKRTKTFRHALYRTDEGKIGVTYYFEQVRTKGITYFFNYEGGTKEIVLDEILFTYPTSVVTDKGIVMGKSNFKEVEEKYGIKTTVYNKNQATKEYDGIEFYSNKFIGQDSIDQSFIVTGIRIKRQWPYRGF